MNKSVDEIRDCRDIVEPLRQTWHEAANAVATHNAPARSAAPVRQPVSTGAGSFGELGVG